MNILRQIKFQQLVRFAETAASKTIPKFLTQPLKNRSLIQVKGPEVVPYLQGLITNDMYHLHAEGKPSMFTMFLNNGGKVLYDAIVYRTKEPNTFLIECDREVSDALEKHLRVYRVRRKINITSIDDELTPWVVFSPRDSETLPQIRKAKLDNILVSPDPRLKNIGMRLIQPVDNNIRDVEEIFQHADIEKALTDDEYITHRYNYGVGEGIVDHPPGKCFPLEANCDFLHGVSFHKGCYVGQELTARVYHTGVIRKRLMPLKFTNYTKCTDRSVQTPSGVDVGTIRGVMGKQGLALLRVEKVLQANQLVVDGVACRTFKPDWWPKELPTRPPTTRKE